MVRVRLAPLRRVRDRERGAAAVEFALVSTLLFSLLLGIIAFGFALYRQQSALHAAREGARLAAVGVNNCTAFQNEVADRGTGASIDPVAVELSYSDGTPAPGEAVTVEVPYEVDLSILGFLGFDAFTASQSGTARVEQVGTVTACP
jgi:Flp pilus assembly pilin Flp